MTRKYISVDIIFLGGLLMRFNNEVRFWYVVVYGLKLVNEVTMSGLIDIQEA